MNPPNPLQDRRPGERCLTAPALTVRFMDAGLAASSLTARPGVTSGPIDAGDGLFLSGDPDYPPERRWAPLDGLGLRFLLELVRRSPSDPDQLVDEMAGAGADGPADRERLQRLIGQLWEAGLLAPESDQEWSARGRQRRTDRIAWDHVPSAESPETLDLSDGRVLRRTDQCALLVTSRGFERLHADGRTREVLTPDDVVVLHSLGQAGRDAPTAYSRLGDDATAYVSRDRFDQLLRSLGERGLVVNFDPVGSEKMVAALRKKEEAFRHAEAELRNVVEEERRRAAETGVKRPIVIAPDADANPLLSLGAVVAYAMAYDEGCLTESYRFAPLLYTASNRFTSLLGALEEWPAVFLFSDYLWTREVNLAMSALVKEHVPGAITVHGGPEMPKYAEDAEQFFAENPHVDCGVRGEGEATLAALLQALVPTIPSWGDDGALTDLTPLADVAGLTFRSADGLVRTEDRERIADLESIPSPYLTGLFDDVERRDSDTLILETNRGCPYGCTFCDWGSATLSRIRKFSLERVKAEMEWAARRGIANFGLADANFGILERDVEIAEWAVELKERYGAPTAFQATYAKSRVQHLTRIVRLLAEADILTQAAVSVQTMDKEVLQIVRRKNLDLDRHLPLVSEFEDLGLPLHSDVMVGLPGSTVETVRADLQFCIDREIHYRPNPTQLLVNSPMNEEAYRKEHGIVAKPGEWLLEGATYTREDMRLMMDMCEYLLLADRRGTLRELATYVRSELEIPETEFYRRLMEAGRDSRRWPHLGYLNTVAAREFVPPGSWAAVIEELGDFMVHLGIADDDALATVLAVQLAVLPMPGRTFPETLHLPHDYVAWHADIRDARQRVPEGTWVAEIEPLRTFGPGELVIRDDADSCARVIGVRPRGYWEEIVWELDTPIARAAQRVVAPV